MLRGLLALCLLGATHTATIHGFANTFTSGDGTGNFTTATLDTETGSVVFIGTTYLMFRPNHFVGPRCNTMMHWSGSTSSWIVPNLTVLPKQATEVVFVDCSTGAVKNRALATISGDSSALGYDAASNSINAIQLDPSGKGADWTVTSLTNSTTKVVDHNKDVAEIGCIAAVAEKPRLFFALGTTQLQPMKVYLHVFDMSTQKVAYQVQVKNITLRDVTWDRATDNLYGLGLFYPGSAVPTIFHIDFSKGLFSKVVGMPGYSSRMQGADGFVVHSGTAYSLLTNTKGELTVVTVDLQTKVVKGVTIDQSPWGNNGAPVVPFARPVVL